MKSICKKILKNDNKHIFLFVFMLLVSTALSFIFILKSNGSTLDNIFFPNDSFMDFYNCIIHSNFGRPYEIMDTIYPPLCYIIYSALSLLVPYSSKIYGSFAIKLSFGGSTAFILYFTLMLLLTIYALSKILKNNKYKDVIVFCILISSPFLFSYDRANIINVALAFSLLFFAFKDDENKYKREFSYICLAVAAGLKIYPAIFGLTLLNEKRYKDAIRCAIYGVLMYIVPFMLMGGLGSVGNLIHNLSIGVDFLSGIVNKYKVNFASTISLMFNINETSITNYFYLLIPISLIPMFKCKENWLNVIIMTILLICVPSISFEYTMIFMSIPLLILLNDKKMSISKCICFVLISLSMANYAFINIPNDYVTCTVAVQKIILILLYLYALCLEYIIFFKSIKNIFKKKEIRFLLVGGLNTVFGYGIYALLIYLGMNYYIANIISTVLGVFHSYLWNRYYTFKSKEKAGKEIVRFIFVYLISFGISNLILYIFVTRMDLNEYFAGLINLVITTLISWFGHKYFSFKGVNRSENNKHNDSNI